MNKNHKKVFRIIILILVSVLLTCWYTFLCKGIRIDADKANHLLQANDILNGNLFLSGWHMTGITFWTTDLIYYELASLIAGVSNMAIYIAGGLMLASAALASYSLITDIEDRFVWLRRIILVSLLFVPTNFFLTYSRVHMGAVFISLLLIKIASKMSADNVESVKDIFHNKNYLFWGAVLFILVMAGVNGDKLVLIEGVAPILFLAAYRIIVDNKNLVNYLAISVLSIAGTLSALVLEKLFYALGGAISNNYIETVEYSHIFDWQRKVETLIAIVMEFMKANFFNEPVGNKMAIIKILAFFVCILAFIFLGKIIVEIVMRKAEKLDEISVMLSVSVVLISASFIFTGNSHAKYITIIPYALIILLLRNIESVTTGVKNLKLWLAIIVGIAVLILLGSIKEISVNKVEEDRESLVQYLEDKGLTNGYAAFWNASVFTVASNDTVKVRHIRFDEGFMQEFKWFCKDAWYEDEANFVIIRTDSEENQYNINEETVRYIFGEPKEIELIGQYIVYSYDYDISSKLLKM